MRRLIRRLRAEEADEADEEDETDEETVRTDGDERTDGTRTSSELRTDGDEQTDGPRASSEIRSDGGATREPPWTGVSPGIRWLRNSEFVRSLPFWLLPAIYMGVFVYGAIGWNVVISLTDWEGFGTPSYADLDLSMYVRMLNDPNFWLALRNTLALLVVFTMLSLAVGLVLAILVDRGVRFENTFRTVYLLPMSLSFVVTAIFWSWMYNFEIGLVNELLRFAGLDFLTQQWISDPRFKLFAVIFALMWQFSGYCMVVYLAGLRAIPNDLYEAAKVDGASTVRMYWRVIIPQLRASTTSAAVVLMVFALKAFDFLFVMFGTNPGPSADILAMMMFRQAFGVSNWAYGSAIATVLFLLAVGIISPYLYLQYKRGDL